MTDDFKKARDKANGNPNLDESEDGFRQGADWAYIWCANETEHNSMSLLNEADMLAKALNDIPRLSDDEVIKMRKIAIQSFIRWQKFRGGK